MSNSDGMSSHTSELQDEAIFGRHATQRRYTTNISLSKNPKSKKKLSRDIQPLIAIKIQDLNDDSFSLSEEKCMSGDPSSLMKGLDKRSPVKRLKGGYKFKRVNLRAKNKIDNFEYSKQARKLFLNDCIIQFKKEN